MTFSQQVKSQVCENINDQVCCLQSLVFSILLFSRGYVKDTISFHTENRLVAHLFANAVAELTGASVSVISPIKSETAKRKLYTVLMEDEQDKDMVLSYINEQYDAVTRRVLKERCCAKAFVVGAFLIAGTVVDPKKEYHLEFAFTNEGSADVLKRVLTMLKLKPHEIKRRTDVVLYYKNSEKIEGILTLMGAVQSSFDLMNLKIEKELRNNVNRALNCENANVDKTIRAAVDQINCINRFIEAHGELSIPQELREIARVRLENPHMSLSEMCGLFSAPISRSTLSRKLKRLCNLEEELF